MRSWRIQERRIFTGMPANKWTGAAAPLRVAGFAGMLIAGALLLASCADTGGGPGGGIGKVQKFYSAAEPGRWEAQAADHDVRVTIIEDNGGKRGIEAHVPFTDSMSEEHYVEVMFLMDAKNRELAKVRFRRGEKARALFEVPAGALFPLNVVAKCNMHDMWRRAITHEDVTRDGE